MPPNKRAALLALLCGTFVARSDAADWPRFRGQGGTATSDERGLPTSWSGGENIAWKADLPGPGASSPIVVGDRVFVTCYSGYGLDAANPGDLGRLKRHLLCLDRATGETIWTYDAPAAGRESNYVDFLVRHGYATSTPTSDGERVYVFFGTSGVRALDLHGKPLWQADVGELSHNWGTGGSLALDGELLLVNAAVESDSFIALDKRTGAEIWRVKRLISSWSTPAMVELPGGARELIVSIKGRLLGLDPATGERLWSCQTKQSFASPSPIVNDGLIFAFGGRPNVLLAVRPGGRGDVTGSHVLWRAEGVGSGITSPVLYEGLIYTIDERGIVGCVRAETGEVVYRQRLSPSGATLYASPIAADGKLFAVSREHGTFVLAAGPQFKQLAVNQLNDASVFNATPAISRGQLLLRSDRALYCIGLRR
ncbi:MAG TPA: PQQ-binding-like beta-propeller repeat protein [Thermomicrobiales bacterium]|nr:PQQ-binding-like beta-propeller repeat protein [Thermomicrobiales bacterium]